MACFLQARLLQACLCLAGRCHHRRALNDRAGHEDVRELPALRWPGRQLERDAAHLLPSSRHGGAPPRAARACGCALAIYDLDDLTETTDGTTYYLGATTEELARHTLAFGRNPHVIDHLSRRTYVKANVRCDIPWDAMVLLRDELRRCFPALDFVFPTLHGPFIDILPHGWSKGRAVEVLAEHLGITLDDIAVFGDSENDISMLKAVPHSVVVRNASPEARAAARYRIGLSADDTVADALFALADAAKTGELPAFLRPLDYGREGVE